MNSCESLRPSTLSVRNGTSSKNTNIKSIKEANQEAAIVKLKFILFQLWPHISCWDCLNAAIIWNAVNQSGFNFCWKLLLVLFSLIGIATLEKETMGLNFERTTQNGNDRDTDLQIINMKEEIQNSVHHSRIK